MGIKSLVDPNPAVFYFLNLYQMLSSISGVGLRTDTQTQRGLGKVFQRIKADDPVCSWLQSRGETGIPRHSHSSLCVCLLCSMPDPGVKQRCPTPSICPQET